MVTQYMKNENYDYLKERKKVERDVSKG